ncbi:phosphotransferase [Aliiroseovarius sp. F20344]|uniref:phosphotransferase enzyme family protein n=1 Tax=Aliiroseovarius sp. F20344 TaxID=2926414 RepID=UPI001FF40642|nr:phosphotransferase [Aliiroseovarius sp. F20344]MCK0141022.1 phosphotransferase [Aliiroseovarius sp. F20344]
MSTVLKQALKAWGAQHVRMIKDRENAVHEVRVAGKPAALRLHRPGYQSEAAIRSELDWMGALAEKGMRVPAPIPTTDGNLVFSMSSDQLATMVTWVEGAPIGEGGVPLEGSAEEQAALYRKVGAELAQLHNLTDGITLPDSFTRHRWDIPGLLGDDPFWGRFWECPALSEDDRNMVLRARAVAHDLATVYLENGADFGLIHADALRENVFVNNDLLTLIDFDDAGFGFRLYDLAVMMTQNVDEPAYEAIKTAALAGYRDHRALSQETEDLLPMFLMMRRFASMGWAVPRYDPNGPEVASYTQRAVAAARGFLGG